MPFPARYPGLVRVIACFELTCPNPQSGYLKPYFCKNSGTFGVEHHCFIPYLLQEVAYLHLLVGRG